MITALDELILTIFRQVHPDTNIREKLHHIKFKITLAELDEHRIGPDIYHKWFCDPNAIVTYQEVLVYCLAFRAGARESITQMKHANLLKQDLSTSAQLKMMR